MTIPKQLAKSVTALAALTALALTACSPDEETAQFEEAVQDEAPEAEPTEVAAEGTDEEPGLDDAESGLVVEEFGQEAAVVDSASLGDEGEIITPAGTLSISSVETVETVPAAAIGQEGEGELQPAEGEVFRVVEFSFTPDEATQGFDADVNASADLALNVGGVQNHLHELDSSQDHRILFSVPEDSSAQLVVSSEGHDQSADILTGERQTEEDDAAAAYYREVTNQDPNHSFPLEDGEPIQVVQDNNPDREVGTLTTQYDLHVGSVSLTAWTPEEGWAAPGEAWVVIDWEHDFDIDISRNTMTSGRFDDIDFTVTLEADSQQQEDFVADGGDATGSSGEWLHVFAVPVETLDLQVSFSAAHGTSYNMAGQTIADGETTDFEFTAEELEVEFPDSRYSSDESEVEEADEDEGQENGDDEEDEDDGA